MVEMLTEQLIGTQDFEPVNVGAITDQLLKSFDRAGLVHTKSWDLVQDMLAFAAHAEQRLAEQSERINQLESIAVTDELTGLLNRRGFQDALDRALSDAARHDEQGLVAFIDLDRFKAINDTHGHEAGDIVLRAVADLLIEEVRTSDYVARLAGDEFVILFVRADHCARARALAIKSRLNRLMVPYRGNLLRVKASMGIQNYGKTSTANDLMCRADKAMYRDKAQRA